MVQQAELNHNKDLESTLKSVESLKIELDESSAKLIKLKEHNQQIENKFSLQRDTLVKTEERLQLSLQELNLISNELTKEHKLVTESEAQFSQCNTELISLQNCNEQLKQQLELKNKSLSEIKDKLTEQNKVFISTQEALAESKNKLEKIKAEYEKH